MPDVATTGSGEKTTNILRWNKEWEPLATVLQGQAETLPLSVTIVGQRQQSAPVLGDCSDSRLL